MQEWYFGAGKERVGPYSTEQMKTAISEGRVTRRTLVWTESQGDDWVAAADSELDSAFKRSPPPLPDEHHDTTPPPLPEQAAEQRERPGGWQYVLCWIFAFALVSGMNALNSHIIWRVQRENELAAVVLFYLGLVITGTIFVLCFELIFRHLDMAVVKKWSLRAGGAMLVVGLASTTWNAVTAGDSYLTRPDQPFMWMLAPGPLVFWAVVWIHLMRVARQGRIWPSGACPPDIPRHTNSRMRVSWVLFSVVVLIAAHLRVATAIIEG